MGSAQVLVCERAGRWTTALRRRLAARGTANPLPLVELRTLAECDRALERWPASLVALEVSADNLTPLLKWIAALERRSPAARAVALLARDVTEHAWALREAGAMLIVSSPRETQPLIEMADWHLAQAPPADANCATRIWAELPWNPTTLDGSNRHG